jgi:F-type H+-transporting ATPase subunit b
MTLSKCRKGRLSAILGIALLGLFVFWGLGLAAEGGGHGGHDSERVWDLGYRFLNFALLVIILFVVIRKTAIKDFFSNRREEIKRKFEDLKKERDAAERRYQELENELKAFELKKKEILKQFELEGTVEKEKIIAEAKERSKQILEQTDLAIQREIQAARDRLQAEMAEVASQKAQEIIEKQIKDRDQDQLINEFIEKVEKLH